MTSNNGQIDPRVSALVRKKLSRFFLKARLKSGLSADYVQAATGVDILSLECQEASFPLDEIEKLTGLYRIPILRVMKQLAAIQIEIQRLEKTRLR